jgi:hypothetical protein
VTEDTNKGREWKHSTKRKDKENKVGGKMKRKGKERLCKWNFEMGKIW